MKFTDKLKSLGYASYKDYLQSDYWWNFREAWRDDGQRMTCDVCGADKIDLHHITYQRLGEERFTDIVPVCRVHHEAIHAWLKDRNKFVDATLEAIAYLKSKAGPVCAVVSPRRGREKKPIKQKKLSSRQRQLWTCQFCGSELPAHSKAERRLCAKNHHCGKVFKVAKASVKIDAKVKDHWDREHKKAVDARRLTDGASGPTEAAIRLIVAGIKRPVYGWGLLANSRRERELEKRRLRKLKSLQEKLERDGVRIAQHTRRSWCMLSAGAETNGA